MPTPCSTCASEPAPASSVLPREAERLVVVCVEQKPRVVDLGHVDLEDDGAASPATGSRASGRTGAGRRRRPPARGSPRRCRRSSSRAGSPRGGKADHLAVAVGLHLLAGDHDQVPVARQLDRLERTARTLWSVTADGSEAVALGVSDQLDGLIEQSCSGSCACGGRRRSSPGRRAAPSRAVSAAAADGVRPSYRRSRRSATSSGQTGGRRPSCEGVLLARLLVLREPEQRAAAASSGCEETSGGSTIAQPAAAASSRRRGGRPATGRRSRRPGGSARASPVMPVRTWTRSRSRIRIDGARRAWPSEDDRLPAVEVAQRAQGCADDEGARRPRSRSRRSSSSSRARRARGRPRPGRR